MIENIPNLVKKIDIEVQEVQRVPNKMNPKWPTPRHIIMNIHKVKDKERFLKAAREKQVIYQKKLCRLEEIGKKYSK